MSGEEDFLSRWSRRKRASTEPMAPSGDAVDVPAAPSASEVSASSAGTDEATDTSEKEEFDLSSLPPIDSIVEGTDISGFLRRGVPPDLARAALRRAWSTDPVIRDFIGLAENAWDFNDPTAMPGFGPLDQTPEQVSRMLAQVMGEIRESVEASDTAPVESEKAHEAIADADDASALPPGTGNESDPPSLDQTPVSPQIDIATQHSETANEQLILRRTHGGALPS